MRILSLALLALGAAAAATSSSSSAKFTSCDAGDWCAGTTPASALQATHLCSDKRLGPAALRTGDALRAALQAKSRALRAVLRAYDPFRGSCPGEFLAKFARDGAWFSYPPKDGFRLDAAGNPVRRTALLAPGTLVDRFGSERGSFLSPCGTPYEKRSLPPANLATDPADPGHPFSYHVYKVVKPLSVMAGPIAPFFNQPGLGEQYKLDFDVASALKQGFLEKHASDCGAGGKMMYRSF